MKTVIIAEKPSQAKAYAEAFTIKNKTKTYIELEACDTFKQGAYLTWGIGHLIELKLPQDMSSAVNTWNLSNLPFLPKRYEYKVSDGKSAQFNTIKKLCKDADLIINGCDVDREGSNIFYLILQHAGITNKPIKRLWINSLEQEEVKKGFNNLMDNNKDLLMFEEAKARMVSDYLIGMNLSPLYTLKLQSLGLNNMVFGIGRVQTPTLYMIYERYKEIENFKSEPYYEIHGIFHKNDEQYRGKMKLKEKDKSKVDTIYKDLSNESVGTIVKVDKQEKSQQSPKLHSLSTLQTTANKKWKYSPKKVLEIMQKLYEKKVVSYPRTDTQYITDQEFNYLKNNLNSYLDLYNIEETIQYEQPRKRYVDSSKVQEHYAIILTKNSPKVNLETLSQEEKHIFEEIYNTTIAMFLPDYQYEKTEVITQVADHAFYSTGTVDKHLGWKSLFKQKEKEKEDKLPLLRENDQVQADTNIYEGMTQPPKPFTEGQLINLMKTCGKYVEDSEDTDILKEIEGIGTEATRADVIDKLKHHEYIKVSKNTVEMTKKGILLCKAITGTLLSSPEMTAKWEIALKGISNQTMNFETFIGNIERYITHQMKVVDKELENNDIKNSVKLLSQETYIAECPKCHDGMIFKKKTKSKGDIYPCTNEECKFVIFGNISGRTITPDIVKQLCHTKQTEGYVKGFKSKKGNTFEAQLILDDDYKVKMKFKYKKNK